MKCEGEARVREGENETARDEGKSVKVRRPRRKKKEEEK